MAMTRGNLDTFPQFGLLLLLLVDLLAEHYYYVVLP
jgi:hypothetical protein